VKPLKEWGRLAAAMLLILAGVEGLVRAAINFGDLLGTPSFLWGITVVAAGTSVPDASVSVRAAPKGEAVTSLANVLGCNAFRQWPANRGYAVLSDNFRGSTGCLPPERAKWPGLRDQPSSPVRVRRTGSRTRYRDWCSSV
jgi:hypothetical protein